VESPELQIMPVTSGEGSGYNIIVSKSDVQDVQWDNLMRFRNIGSSRQEDCCLAVAEQYEDLLSISQNLPAAARLEIPSSSSPSSGHKLEGGVRQDPDLDILISGELNFEDDMMMLECDEMSPADEELMREIMDDRS